MLLDLTDYSSEPIHAQISRQLRARILAGTLEADMGLQPRRFAREQRVAITSVERAFESLADEGLLAKTGEGAYRVQSMSEDSRREMAQQQHLETVREEALSAKELELAREIQCRLLPPPRLDGPGWTVVARNEPARFVAGDFYDLLRHADGSLDLVVADVSGKGIGPSLIMASVKAVLPFLTEGRPVVDVMGELNRRLCGELGRREFVALAIARYQPSTGRLELANAGLPDPYCLRAGAAARGPGEEPTPPRVEPLEVSGERLPLGLRAEVSYASLTLRLDPGDRVLLVSDGLPEAATDEDEPFGYERLAEHLAAHVTPEESASSSRSPSPLARLASRMAPGAREVDAERPKDVESWLDAMLDGLHRATAIVQPDDWTAMILERRR